MKVVIKHRRTGNQETVDQAKADRLKESQFGPAFEFIPIIDPPELKEASVPKKKKSAKDSENDGVERY